MGVGGPLYRGGVMGGFGMGTFAMRDAAAVLGLASRATELTGDIWHVCRCCCLRVHAFALVSVWAADALTGLSPYGMMGMGGMTYGTPYLGPLYANALYPGTVSNPYLPPPPFGLGYSNTGLGVPMSSGLRYGTYPVQITVVKGGKKAEASGPSTPASSNSNSSSTG